MFKLTKFSYILYTYYKNLSPYVDILACTPTSILEDVMGYWTATPTLFWLCGIPHGLLLTP